MDPQEIFFVQPRPVGHPIVGTPLSAEVSIEYTPTPGEGSPVFPKRRSAMLYRNSDGKTRVEIFRHVPREQNERPEIIDFTDPKECIGDVLDVRNHIDHRISLREVPFMMAGGCCPEKMIALQSAELSLLTVAGKTMPNLGYGSRGDGINVDPIAEIDGFDVEGYGQRLTLPKGTNGNQKDITVTIKTWYAPSIKAVMLIEVIDSRSGITKIGLSNVKKGEPEPSFFVLPSGYRLVEEKESFNLR